MTSDHWTDPEPEPEPAPPDPASAGDVYDDDETELITERLTALGYIE